VNEIGPPDVLQSYATSPGGGLTPLDEVSSGGNGPAFCTGPDRDPEREYIPIRELFEYSPTRYFRYGSGNGEFIPTVNGGTEFDNSTSVLMTFARTRT
jgi:hypothetical protein